MTDSATGSRVERRMRETRERIRKAALELFTTRGLDETTVADITDAADIGKGTFFTYFPTKTAVLADVAAMLMEGMEAGLIAASAGGLDFAARLERLFAPALDWHQGHPEISRFLAAAFLRESSYAEAERVNIGRLLTLLGREVAASQARGELTRDIPPGQATTTIFGVYFGALTTWHLGGRRDRLHDHFATFFHVAMRGLRP
jgi:AcrR family transcriptional regulator